MTLKVVSRNLIAVSIASLLTGCLNTADFRPQDKTHQINQLTERNRQLQRQINDLTADSGQLSNDNAQLRADNTQLKQRLLVAVQVLDTFRKELIDGLNKLPGASGLLELVGNQIVERPGVIPVANGRKPVLLVNTQDTLSPYFVVRRFGGFFKAPTQVELWLLNYHPESDSYMLSYRSNPQNVGENEAEFEVDTWQAASREGTVYGFYFPNGNPSLAYHPTSSTQDVVGFSKQRSLATMTRGQSVKLKSERQLQGVQISWGVMGLRQ